MVNRAPVPHAGRPAQDPPPGAGVRPLPAASPAQFPLASVRPPAACAETCQRLPLASAQLPLSAWGLRCCRPWGHPREPTQPPSCAGKPGSAEALTPLGAILDRREEGPGSHAPSSTLRRKRPRLLGGSCMGLGPVTPRAIRSATCRWVGSPPFLSLLSLVPHSYALPNIHSWPASTSPRAWCLGEPKLRQPCRVGFQDRVVTTRHQEGPLAGANRPMTSPGMEECRGHSDSRWWRTGRGAGGCGGHWLCSSCGNGLGWWSPLGLWGSHNL